MVTSTAWGITYLDEYHDFFYDNDNDSVDVACRQRHR